MPIFCFFGEGVSGLYLILFPLNLHTFPDLTFLKRAGSLDLDSGGPRTGPLRGSFKDTLPLPHTPGKVSSRSWARAGGIFAQRLGSRDQVLPVCPPLEVNPSCSPPGCAASQGPQGPLSCREPQKLRAARPSARPWGWGGSTGEETLQPLTLTLCPHPEDTSLKG